MKAYNLLAPRVLSVELDRSAFLSHIYSFQKEKFAPDLEARGDFKTLVIDLREVERLTLDGALPLVAEYHRSIVLSPNFRPTIFDGEWPEQVRALLEELGFYQLVRAKQRVASGSNPLAGGLRFVRFRSDELVDPDLAEELINDLAAAAGDAPESIEAYEGLIEAIKNVRQHAYLEEAAPPSVVTIVRRWWAAGAYDPSRQVLQFIVYDQGYGIPATLPKREFWEAVRAICPVEFDDADVIVGALEHGRTRTKQHGRGNGLWTICSVVDHLPGSSVRIVSGRGEVTYAGPSDVRRKRHPNPFCGTLVQWTLRLPSGPSSAGLSA